jgi:chaperonin cofactor prefoldin
MVVVSIASLKVTVREVFGATDEAESAGEDEETVGAVVSVVVVLSLSEVVDVVEEPSSLLLAQEMTVRLKQEIRKTNKNFFIFSSIPKVKYYCFVY